jgi:hypothetical protein
LKVPLELSVRRFQRGFRRHRMLFWLHLVARRCILGNRSPGGCGCDLVVQWRCKFHSIESSLRRIQRSVYTYRRPSWQTPVLRRCIPENRRVGGLLMRIGDANFTQLNTPLNLSIRRFQRRFYTYRRQFWQAPVVRRCFLKEQAFMSSTTVMCHQRWLHWF